MRAAATSMDKGDRKAVQALLEQMAPTLEDMEGLKEKFQEAGLQIPAALSEVLESADTAKMMAGMGGDFWREVGSVISESDEYMATYNAVKDKMSLVPPSIEEGFKETAPPIIEGMYAWSNEYMQEQFSKGFDVKADVRLNFNPIISPMATQMPAGTTQVKKHASGGILRQPHIGMVAEEGPEAWIPLDGSANAVSVWEQAGRELGVTNSDNRSSITYAPVYQISGADEATVRRATADDYDRFVLFMGQYQKDRARLAF